MSETLQIKPIQNNLDNHDNDAMSPRALRALSPSPNAEKPEVLNAVQKNGLLLRILTAFQTDEEIVSAAAKQNVRALLYASPRLKGDERFMLDMIQGNGLAYQYASGLLKNNPEFQIKAANTNGVSIATMFPSDKKKVSVSDLRKHAMFPEGRTSPEQREYESIFGNSK